MLTEDELVSLKRVILSVQVAQKRGAYELPEAHAIFESVKVLDALIKKIPLKKNQNQMNQ